MNVARQPFQMKGSRGATSRRPGGRPLTGRASFVWLHGVLVPLACGLAPDGVEIRRESPAGPWHLITGTPDEAWELLVKHYPLQRGLRRMVARRRALLEDPPSGGSANGGPRR